MKQSSDLVGDEHPSKPASGEKPSGYLSMKMLAIDGAQPAFDPPLHVGRPNIGDRESFRRRVDEILDRNWLTNDGPVVRDFEARIRDVIGVRNCVAMCNATVGLEIAIRALGLSGEVIVPSFTFIATAHSLQWQEITPVFCDVDRRSHNIDPACVERLISAKTTGILATHLWGRGADVVQLEEIAERRGLKLLFDAAHAFGCSTRGRMIGGFGSAEVFSFHATKFINACEGGAVVTNDDDLAQKLRLMRNFGFAGLDRVEFLGTNGKLNEISAAMGLTSLDSYDVIVSKNKQNWELYRVRLLDLPGLVLAPYDERERSNFQYVIVDVDQDITGLSRDDFVDVLTAEGVLARRYFHPGCHRMEPYRTLYPDAGANLPETERLSDRIFALPTGSAVGEIEIAKVCDILETAMAHAQRLHLKLACKRPEVPTKVVPAAHRAIFVKPATG